VEDLGAAGLEAGALAGGHDDDAEVFLHTGIMVSWREAGKGFDAKCAKFGERVVATSVIEVFLYEYRLQHS
jgi:hypothetical protein